MSKAALPFACRRAVPYGQSDTGARPGRHIMTETIGIIGGSGFIGQHLIRELAIAGYTIHNLDVAPPEGKSPSIYFPADLRDMVSLRVGLKNCTSIINLAAVHRDDVRPLSLYHDVNVQGSENLCTVAAELGITRIIFTSSVAIYGMQDGIPDETAPAKPFNAYGETKWAAEAKYQAWAAADANRSLVIVRPTVVFGAGNRGNVYNLIAQIAKGRFVMVGAGRNRKSMAYVENVSGFLAHIQQATLSSGVRVYNYVDKPDLDMNTLVATVRGSLGQQNRKLIRLPYIVGLMAGFGFDVLARLTGKTFPVSVIRIKKFCANTIFASEKRNETGYVARVKLEDALADTIQKEFGC